MFRNKHPIMSQDAYDELQEHINQLTMESTPAEASRPDNPHTIAINNILNQYIRGLLKEAGFAPPDTFNPVEYQALHRHTVIQGKYEPRTNTITINGENCLDSAYAVALVASHEAMHLIQRFIFKYKFYEYIKGEMSETAAAAKFSRANKSFFKGKNKPELSLKDIATARLIVPKTNSNVPIKTSPGLSCLSIILPRDMF